jgi:hypothetical protein
VGKTIPPLLGKSIPPVTPFIEGSITDLDLLMETFPGDEKCIRDKLPIH